MNFAIAERNLQAAAVLLESGMEALDNECTCHDMQPSSLVCPACTRALHMNGLRRLLIDLAGRPLLIVSAEMTWERYSLMPYVTYGMRPREEPRIEERLTPPMA